MREEEVISCVDVPGWVLEKAGVSACANPNFPEDVFKIIKEYNGIVGFSKQLINILRYSSADDLELILKLVAGNIPPFDFQFN